MDSRSATSPSASGGIGKASSAADGAGPLSGHSAIPPKQGQNDLFSELGMTQEYKPPPIVHSRTYERAPSETNLGGLLVSAASTEPSSANVSDSGSRGGTLLPPQSNQPSKPGLAVSALLQDNEGDVGAPGWGMEVGILELDE
eukprot:GHVT01006042.1.p1 GENE.GHVT01006042.1~~GHVT01006042.1.p1  ORF type:complete len:143 (+),score=19.14 GHVT01006042.1:423-851(+)